MATSDEILQQLRAIDADSGTGSSSQSIQGAGSAGATLTGNALPVAGAFNPSGVSLSNYSTWPLQLDSRGALKVTESRYSNYYLTLASMSAIAVGAGFVRSVTIGSSSMPTLSLWDNPSGGSVTAIHVFDANTARGSYVLEAPFTTGLSAFFALGNAPSVSINFKPGLS